MAKSGPKHNSKGKRRNDNIVKWLPNCQLLLLEEEAEAKDAARSASSSADLRAARAAVQLVASLCAGGECKQRVICPGFYAEP